MCQNENFFYKNINILTRSTVYQIVIRIIHNFSTKLNPIISDYKGKSEVIFNYDSKILFFHFEQTKVFSLYK